MVRFFIEPSSFHEFLARFFFLTLSTGFLILEYTPAYDLKPTLNTIIDSSDPNSRKYPRNFLSTCLTCIYAMILLMYVRSVVLLVHHDERGSYGLVVNKDKGQTLKETICNDQALPLASDALQQVLGNPVRSGGPVMSRLAWLHHHEEVGGVPLSEDAENPVIFFLCDFVFGGEGGVGGGREKRH